MESEGCLLFSWTGVGVNESGVCSVKGLGGPWVGRGWALGGLQVCPGWALSGLQVGSAVSLYSMQFSMT